MLASPAPIVAKVQAPAPLPPLAFSGSIEVLRFPSGEAVRLATEAEGRLAQEIVARAQAYREPAPVVIARPPALVFAGAVDVRGPSKREEMLKLDPGPVVVATAPIIPAVAEFPASPAGISAAPEPVPAAPRAPVLLASANPDLARLRAEVEAEIERDRVRLANLQQQACSTAGRPMQGCTISTQKRFSFAG